MPLVDRLERKFGWIAVPGIVKIIMTFQALVWLLSSLRGDNDLLFKIFLHKESILNGEVWRLVSFVITPPVAPGLDGTIFMFFAVFFSIFLGNMLESIWGSFRLTLYLIGGVVCMVIAEFVIPFPLDISPEYQNNIIYLHSLRSFLLIESILFACAVYNPHYVVRLFGIIPVKLYWIALFGGGLLVINAVDHPSLGVVFLISLSNFFIVFVPGMKRSLQMRAQVAARRTRFEAAKVPENEPLHLCAGCGVTENDDEDLIFRVADDGEEYCENCRGKNANRIKSSDQLIVKNEDGTRPQVKSEDEDPDQKIVPDEAQEQKMVSRYKDKKKRPGGWKE